MIEPVNQFENIDEMGAYKKQALKVVQFRIIYDEDDLNGTNKSIITFKPDMAHQIFGDNELIFGYRSLSITLNYIHNSNRCYVDIENSGKISDTANLKCDDILNSLNPFLPAGYTCSLDEFNKMLEDENHEKIHGEIIKEIQDTRKMEKFPNHDIKATYKITKNDVNNSDFKTFHQRFQTYIIWYIDAANFIDIDDKRWVLYYVYEEFIHPEKKQLYRTPIGFCSVYNFYAYPNNIRPRISQFLILPSHQRRGIGSFLYETIANELRSISKVIDIAVEEPTMAFQKIRDFHDCQLIKNEITSANTNFSTTSSRVIFNMAKKKKIGKKQTQRIYDILSLFYASKSAQIKKDYLNSIKNRIIKMAEESTAQKRRCAANHLSLDVDQSVQIEAQYKRYLEDIEPSIEYLRKKLEL